MDSPTSIIQGDNNKERGKTKAMAKKRALSNGIVTIALVAVGVVIAAAAGAYAYNASSSAQGGIKATLESVDLIRDSSGAGTFVATVKNNGGVHISSAAVSIPSVTGASITINNIAPGQTGSGTATITAANMGSNVAGTVLTGTVTYTGADGTTSTDTFSVTVRTR